MSHPMRHFIRVNSVCQNKMRSAFILPLVVDFLAVIVSGEQGSSLKPHSHCAGVATVHPDAGQPVYRDAPGHIS